MIAMDSAPDALDMVVFEEKTDMAVPTPDAEPVEVDAQVPMDDGTDPILPTVKAIQQGMFAVGTQVSLQNVIVSSPRVEEGFFVSDGTSDAFSGLWVATDPGLELMEMVTVGSLIDVTGTVSEALASDGSPTTQTRTQIEINTAESILVSGLDTVPEPIELTAAELLLDEIAELYEGVLVRLSDLEVTAFGDDSALILNGLTTLGALFYQVDRAWNGVGTPFDGVVGLLHFTEQGFVIMPRGPDDLIRPETSLNSCLPVGGYAICTEPAPFNRAVAHCAGLGGRLVILETEEENQAVGAMVRPWYPRPF